MLHYGCEIKEKPDEIFYKETSSKLNNFIRTLNELERIAYHKNFVDERVLKEEINAWRQFRTTIRERYL